jgi:hypothetical protein
MNILCGYYNNLIIKSTNQMMRHTVRTNASMIFIYQMCYDGNGNPIHTEQIHTLLFDALAIKAVCMGHYVKFINNRLTLLQVITEINEYYEKYQCVPVCHAA